MLNFIRTLLSQPNRRAMKRPTAITVLECLERRELPAALMNPHRVSYQDKDGDMATVYFSLPLLTESNVNSIFKFDVGSVNNSLNSKQQLKQILIPADAVFDGLQISIELEGEADAIGNDQVDVGEIIANGVDLEAVNIEGDLGRIMVGDSNFSTAGLNSLNVVSLGNRGIATGAAGLMSKIHGDLESLKVQNDIRTASIIVDGDLLAGTIGGSVEGSLFPNSGRIYTTGDIQALKIDGQLRGGTGQTSGRIEALGQIVYADLGYIVGGSGAHSGTVAAGGAIETILVRKNIDGGSGKYSGVINSLTGINAVTVMGSVVGNVEGSGAVRSWGNMQAISIHGNLVGGSQADSGIVKANGDIFSLLVKGIYGGTGVGSGRIDGESFSYIDIINELRGGSGTDSGQIRSDGSIGSANIGRIAGHIGKNSGRIQAGGSVSVAMTQGIEGGQGAGSGSIQSKGDLSLTTAKLIGGTGAGSGRVESLDGLLNSVFIDGQMWGGAGEGSGVLASKAGIGNIIIKGALAGGSGANSGRIQTTGNVVSADIRGAVLGGTGFASGVISSSKMIEDVRIGDSLKGNANSSGQIYAGNGITKLSIAGDVSGKAANSGQIRTFGDINTLSIGGSLRGGSESYSGRILAGTVIRLEIGKDVKGGSASGSSHLQETGYIEAESILQTYIGGSLISGVDSTSGVFINNGAIRAKDRLSEVYISGDVAGNATHSATISFGAKSEDFSMQKFIVNGSVSHLNLLGGISVKDAPVNADAKLGLVQVGGNWKASSIATGVSAGADGRYGTADDTVLSGFLVKNSPDSVSGIGSIVIGGAVSGGAPGSHYGFVAGWIENLKINNQLFKLQSQPANDVLTLGPGMTLREVF